MSTYYYLICNDHKEWTDAVSRTTWGYCFMGDGQKTLQPFIIAHSHCNIEIVDESWYDDVRRLKYRKWENVEEEIEKALNNGRWIRE